MVELEAERNRIGSGCPQISGRMCARVGVYAQEGLYAHSRLRYKLVGLTRLNCQLSAGKSWYKGSGGRPKKVPRISGPPHRKSARLDENQSGLTSWTTPHHPSGTGSCGIFRQHPFT